MLRFNDDAGPAGSDSFSFIASHSSGASSSASAPSRRGRVRSADFGMPERQGLLDLARTYLEVQARLWPDLVGTAAVPAADAVTIAAMADDFDGDSGSSTPNRSGPTAAPASGQTSASRTSGSATRTPTRGRSISNFSTC